MAQRRVHVHIGRIEFRGGVAIDADHIAAAIRAQVLGVPQSRNGSTQEAQTSHRNAERIGAAVAHAVRAKAAR